MAPDSFLENALAFWYQIWTRFRLISELASDSLRPKA
jgi:hypothetical protein